MTATRPASASARHQQVVDDLLAETRALRGLLDAIDYVKWSGLTPAAGWTIQDQINHLAFFDAATVTAATDPDRFRREAADLMAPGDDFPDRLVRQQRHLSPQQTDDWFTEARTELLDLAARATPG